MASIERPALIGQTIGPKVERKRRRPEPFTGEISKSIARMLGHIIQATLRIFGLKNNEQKNPQGSDRLQGK